MSKYYNKKICKWHDLERYEKETIIETKYYGSTDLIEINIDNSSRILLNQWLALDIYNELGKALEFACILENK